MFSRKHVSTLSRWLGFGLPLVSLVFVNCGGDDELSCGKGTKQSGSTCVASLVDMGGAGGGASEEVDVEFAGVTGVAPVSETVLLVTWGAATPADATFNIYLSKKEDGFNFASPQVTAPAGSRAIELPLLDEDTEYFVVVRAELNGVEDENTVTMSATTQKDAVEPDFAGATKAEPAGSAEVKLSWAAATDDLTPKASLQYVVFIGETKDDIDLEAPFAISAPGAKSVVVKNLPAPDTQYFFVVRAKDAAGNLDDNKTIVDAKSGADTTPPAFSGCTGASAQSASEIKVEWQPATDDTSKADQIVYEVFASKTPEGHNFAEPSFVSTPGAVGGLVPGLARNTQYYLVCRAKDAAGNSDENTVYRSAKTKEDGEPPEFTGVPTISEISPTTFKVSWAAATDAKTDADKIIYEVFLAQATGQQDFKVDPAASVEGATSALVEGLETNTTYYVIVKAKDLAGNRSTNDDEAVVTTLVSFSQDVLPIFAFNCTSCHDNVTFAGQMSLLPPDAYLATVGASGTGVPAQHPAAGVGGLRIAPGNPTTSFLYKRVTALDDATVDDALIMPASGAPITAAEKATLFAWITQGALNN